MPIKHNVNLTAYRENEHGLKYLQRALKTLEDEHVCFLCRRGFENKEEAAFTRSLRRKVEQAAKNAAHQEIQEAEDDLKAVREARPAYDSWVRLKKEIPELQQDIEKQKKSRDSLASEYANVSLSMLVLSRLVINTRGSMNNA